ncbi:MAG: SgcJ/EcaC family oxidoreductase [Methyloligellaceae bacterium]
MLKRTLCGGLPLLLCLIGSVTAAQAGDKEDVLGAMNAWKMNLAASTAEDPSKILSLYAKDGILWGTISKELRTTPDLIKAYFVNAYKKLPKLTVVFKDPQVRVFGDTAINTGYYTFTFEKDGQMKALPARYSFTLVKRDGKWLIADHHSSGMPKPVK